MVRGAGVGPGRGAVPGVGVGAARTDGVGRGVGVWLGRGVGVGAGVAARGGATPSSTGPCGCEVESVEGGSWKSVTAPAGASGIAPPASRASAIARRLLGFGKLFIVPAYGALSHFTAASAGRAE